MNKPATTLTIRDLNPDLKAKLRVQAASHGRSMEAEVRAILGENIEPLPESRRLGSNIASRFAGLRGVDLQLPPRGDHARAVKL